MITFSDSFIPYRSYDHEDFIGLIEIQRIRTRRSFSSLSKSKRHQPTVNSKKQALIDKIRS